MKRIFLPIIIPIFCLIYLITVLCGQHLERLTCNNPGLLVSLGVGLWPVPFPVDFNGNGLTDLIVICTDRPYNGDGSVHILIGAEDGFFYHMENPYYDKNMK